MHAMREATTWLYSLLDNKKKNQKKRLEYGLKAEKTDKTIMTWYMIARNWQYIVWVLQTYLCTCSPLQRCQIQFLYLSLRSNPGREKNMINHKLQSQRRAEQFGCPHYNITFIIALTAQISKSDLSKIFYVFFIRNSW